MSSSSLNYSLYDSLLEPVIVIDANGDIVYCNHAAIELSESSVRRMKPGKELAKILSFQDFNPTDYILKPNNSTASLYKETTYTANSKKEGRCRVSIQKANSRVDQWVIYVRDLTLEETLHKKYLTEIDKKEQFIANLEKVVDQRTETLADLNTLFKGTLDSLSQGVVVFDKTMIAQPAFSKASLDLLECNPVGKNLMEVLQLPATEAPYIERWYNYLLSEKIHFESLAQIGPRTFQHSQNKFITLHYKLMKNDEGKNTGVVLLATDSTDQRKAQMEAEKEKSFTRMILTTLGNKSMFRGFLAEAREILETLQVIVKNDSINNTTIQELMSLAHALKGGASAFYFTELERATHNFESSLTTFKDSKIDERDRLAAIQESLMNVEKAFDHNLKFVSPFMGNFLESTERIAEISMRKIQEFHQALLKEHKKLGDKYAEIFMEVEIQELFNFYDGYSHNLALEKNKIIAPLKITGGNLRIAPERYLGLFRSLIHAFRNIVDHGIETVKERLAVGKPEVGHIELEINVVNLKNQDWLQLKLKDDGAGIDPKKVRRRLSELNYSADDINASDEEVVKHIFDKGFSTRSHVTGISGRGFGMNAILKEVLKMNGTIHVSSNPGAQTIIEITVPWQSNTQQKNNKLAA